MELEYKIEKELGKGAFATVFRVKSSSTKQQYAAKVGRNEGKKFMIKEADIHSRLVHPNILQFVSSFQSVNCGGDGIHPLPDGVNGNCAVMILELCQRATLYSMIKSRNPITLGHIKSWGSDIASGLLYLKEQGIIHRDIKPENMLFCEDRIKIADFGLSDLEENITTEGISWGKVVGTPFYMPIEAFSNIFGYFTDVFALGVLLYNLYTKRRPFEAETRPQLLGALKHQKVNFRVRDENPEGRDPELEDLISMMLSPKSDERPPIEAIVRHPFFYIAPLDDTVIIDPESMDMDMDTSGGEQEMSLETFRALKAEFGNGNRNEFYLYLANKFPDSQPMSMQAFTNLWNML